MIRFFSVVRFIRLSSDGSVGRISSIGIGVRDPEARQQRRLERFHRFRVGIGQVIVADQVQDAVDQQMLEMMGRRDTGGGGFREYGLDREDDVAERTRTVGSRRPKRPLRARERTARWSVCPCRGRSRSAGAPRHRWRARSRLKPGRRPAARARSQERAAPPRRDHRYRRTPASRHRLQRVRAVAAIAAEALRRWRDRRRRGRRRRRHPIVVTRGPSSL